MLAKCGFHVFNNTQSVWGRRIVDLPDWIKARGVEAVAELLGEEPRTVRSWLYLKRSPRIGPACKIVARSGGLVDFNGIYMPFFRLRQQGGEL